MISTATPAPTRRVKVFATSAYADPEPITAFLSFAGLDRVRAHTLVSNPAEADLILFVENSHYLDDYFFSALRTHELVRRYPEKVYMYNPHDRPWYVLPGLYMCMPRARFDPRHMAAGAYLETINPYLTCDFAREPAWLYSFYGATSSPPRYKLALLTHPRGKVIISNRPMYVDDRPRDLQLEYAELLRDSKYILCPRGSGPSSIRLFETLRVGRVPVILSDELVLPAGPDWRQFAVFVPENRWQDIPAILAREEPTWLAKAQLARQAWEQHFAPDTIFNYCIDTLLTINRSPTFTLGFRVRHQLVFQYYRFRKTVVRRLKEALRPARP